MRILFAMLCVTFALSLSATAQELAISTTDAAGFRYFDLPASTYRLKSIGNGSKFAQIDVKRKGKNSWDALIHSPTNKIAIKKGDQIVLAANLRSIQRKRSWVN